MSNIRRRAQDIASRIRTFRLCDPLTEKEDELSTLILALVSEATSGAPKPVLPPHNTDSEEPWEGDGYGIFCTETQAGPHLLFTGHQARARAEGEMSRRQALDDEHEDWLSQDHCVLRCTVALTYWNSSAPDPREAIAT